jgi:ABC-type sugar transport system substrate-binding protein
MARYLFAALLLGVCGCGVSYTVTTPAKTTFKMGFMPKIKGIAYFNACQKGAEEAAAELGIELVCDGPARDDVSEQVRMLDQWVASGFDCIAVAANHPASISPVLKRARAKGILVLTYDADANDGRQYFVNQCSYDDIAKALVDEMAAQTGGKGKVGILTSTLQAPNQRQWADRIYAYQKEKYPEMELLSPEIESQENSKVAVERARGLMEANLDLGGIISLTSVATPAAAEAVEALEKRGKVRLVGLSTPNAMRKYVKNGTVKTVILWKPIDLGYLTVHVADLMRKGEMIGDGRIQAGRLGEVTVRNGHEVLLGPPLKLTTDNIDEYDF